jgi:hypothetical protein
MMEEYDVWFEKVGAHPYKKGAGKSE